MPRHPEPADPYPDPDPDSEARLPLLLPSGSAAHSHGGGGGPRTPSSSSSSSSSRTGEALASLTRGLGRHSVQPAMAGWVLSVAVTAALAGGGGGASDVPILIPSDHGDDHGDGDGGPGWDGDAYPPHLPGGSGTVRYLSLLSSALSLAYPLGLGVGLLLLSRPRIPTAGNIGMGDRGGRIGSLPPALGAALVWALALPPAALFALGGGGMGGAGAGAGAGAGTGTGRGTGTRPVLWVLLLRLLSGLAAGGLPPLPPPPPPAASSAAPMRPFYWLGAALGGPLTVLAGGTVRADPALGAFLAGRSAWGAGGIVLLAAASLAGAFSGHLRGGAGRRGDGDGSGASSSSASSSLSSLLTPSPARPRLGSDDTSRSDRSDLFHDAVEYLEEGLLSPSPSRFSTPASGDGGLRERNASTPSRPGSALRRTPRGTVPPPPAAPSGTAEAQAARGAARGAAALHLGCGAAVGLAETTVPLWLLAPRSLGGLGLGQGPAAVLGAGAALLVAGLARLAGPGAPLAPVMGDEGIAGPRRAAGFPPLRRLRIGSGLLVLAPLLLAPPLSEGSGSASGIPSPSLPRAAAFLALLAASLCMCLEAAADARSLVLWGRAGGGSCGGSTGPPPTPPPPPPPLLGGEALGCAFGGVLLCRTSLPGLAVGAGAAFLGLALHLGSYCLVPAGGGGELLLPSSPGEGGSRGHQSQGRGSLVAELLAIPLGDARALLGLLPCGAWGRRRGGVRFRGAKHMFRRPEGV